MARGRAPIGVGVEQGDMKIMLKQQRLESMVVIVAELNTDIYLF